MKKVSKSLYWTPRILSIIFLCFLTLFSFDVFDTGLGFLGTTLAFFMHNLPVITLTLVLIFSWKHEWLGGITFILAGILYIILLFRNPFEWYLFAWAMQISGVAFLIGILFLMNWARKKKNKKKSKGGRR